MTSTERLYTRAISTRRESRKEKPEDTDRSILSIHDRSGRLRGMLLALKIVLLVALGVISVGPVLWLFKSATSTSQDILREPLGLWPSGIQWDNLVQAFTTIEFGKYLTNTLIIAMGTWAFGLLVATTGAYALAVLRPKYAKVLEFAVLATLFVPGVVTLTALFLTVLDVPLLHINLINTFWAAWLPASASAFNVLLMKTSFDSIPRELFEAARIDGAGATRIFLTIVLPLSRPIIGVVSLLIIIGSWKDFIWPMLVLPNAALQPLSVALPRLARTTELSLLMAGMFLSVVIPIALFLIFQKQILRSSGSMGALKG